MTTVLQVQAALAEVRPRRTRPLSVICRVAEPDTAVALREIVKLRKLHGSMEPAILLDILEYRAVTSGVVTQVGTLTFLLFVTPATIVLA
eukprot:357696-Chlamydomonas_euryale.AAC.3